MMHCNTESFSERIKTALAIRNMKQSELCRKTNIPKSVISEYLKGSYEPKQDRLMLIAEVLDVDPVWLMGYDVPLEKFENCSPDDVITRVASESMLNVFKNCIHDDNLRTDAEKMMLFYFRQIQPDQQQTMLAMMRAYVEGCRPKENREES